MKLIFLHGLPGVGKLTVGKELQKLTGYPLFHNHLTVDLVAAVFPFGSKQFVKLREKIWLEIFEEAAAADIPGLIFTFTFEKSISDEFISKVLALTKKRKIQLQFIALVCEPEDLKKRIVQPDRKKFSKLISPQLFSKLYKEGSIYQPTDLPNNRVVDTTESSPKQAAQDIVQLLKKL